MPETIASPRTAREHIGFALRLHHALVAGLRATRATLCWSPLSVGSAVGLAAQGAAGRTRAELLGLLTGDPAADPGGHADLLTRASRLEEDPVAEQPSFAISNTLWAREDIPFTEPFVDALSRWPNGAVRDAPFGADPDGARRIINVDVAGTTNGLIPELIPPGAVTPATVATLVNALYLKTAWQHHFPERATRDLPFHGASGTGTTPTMRLTERLGYAERDGWQVVTLPAAGGVEAVVLLPAGDLGDAEAALDADGLTALLDAVRSVRVELYLPKFRLEASSALVPVLRSLGVTAMFDDADFTPLSSEPLEVSAVLHHAVLRIDESGLEGAAATAMMFLAAGMVREDAPVVVRVDRPFLFAVRHRASGVLYFLARVLDP